MAQVAERWWRLPLGVAAGTMALAGPAQALGRTDTVFYAALVAVSLGAFAVPFGLLSVHAKVHPEDQEPTP
jgi:hypothetical protein